MKRASWHTMRKNSERDDREQKRERSKRYEMVLQNSRLYGIHVNINTANMNIACIIYSIRMERAKMCGFFYHSFHLETAQHLPQAQADLLGLFLTRFLFFFFFTFLRLSLNVQSLWVTSLYFSFHCESFCLPSLFFKSWCAIAYLAAMLHS